MENQINKAAQPSTLLISWLENDKCEQVQKFELSVYNDNLTTENIGKYTMELKKAFQALNKDFFEILRNSIIRNNFTDNRFRDAVYNLIDTFNFPVPTVANIISWNRKIKLYTYSEVINFRQWTDSMPFTSEFKVTEHEFNGQKLWAKISDLKTYNI